MELHYLPIVLARFYSRLNLFWKIRLNKINMQGKIFFLKDTKKNFIFLLLFYEYESVRINIQISVKNIYKKGECI